MISYCNYISMIVFSFFKFTAAKENHVEENAETTISLLQMQQTLREKKENPLPPPRQVMTTQTQDYHEQTKGFLPSTVCSSLE